MTQSYYRHRFSFVGSTILLLLAQIHYIDNKIGVTNAFSNSPILPSPANSNYGRPHTTRYAIFRSSSEDLETSKQDNKKMILVLGGSGYIGRRICKELVDATEDGDSTKVVSISRNGKPPSWATSLGGNDSWSEKVEWIQHEIGSESEDGKPSLTETLESICEENTETTIVGCIGNVNPTPSWEGLWGLAYDNDLLFEENGKVYEAFLNQTESLRTKGLLSVDRCVLLSLDYTCQKCLEGPIDGYLNGKRLAERKLLEAVTQQNGGSLKDPSNLEKVVVVGLPNFVYGGKRFPTFGKIYRKIVESPIAKAYVGGNQAIRSLSAANPEDWVEAMFFSSPIEVETVGSTTAMAARGLVTRDLVNNGEPRKQGFFNTSGLPVEYDDILFLDGTDEIEALAGKLEEGKSLQTTTKASTSGSKTGEPKWEGALIGKRPYLYPFPVASVFLLIFWGIATEKFVTVASTATL